MAKEVKIVKVIGYSVYPNFNIERDGVGIMRFVFECKDTGKSYVVLSPEDKNTLATYFSLYNGIIPKDKCEKAVPHYARYNFDARMDMFTIDFDNEREFVEREIATYYTDRCIELEKELKLTQDIRAKALDVAREKGFIADDNKKEPDKNESTNPCDWCTHGYGSDTCPIKDCYSWSRFSPIEGTPLFIEQKADSIDW